MKHVARYYLRRSNWALASAGEVPKDAHPTPFQTCKPCFPAKAGTQTGLPPPRENKAAGVVHVKQRINDPSGWLPGKFA